MEGSKAESCGWISNAWLVAVWRKKKVTVKAGFGGNCNDIATLESGSLRPPNLNNLSELLPFLMSFLFLVCKGDGPMPPSNAFSLPKMTAVEVNRALSRRVTCEWTEQVRWWW